jgi:hypothetical protein
VLLISFPLSAESAEFVPKLFLFNINNFANNDIFLFPMQLSRVEIKNYRSIRELKLRFEPKCRILVGINESGKTNILNALKLLDPSEVSTRRDLREPGLREAQIREAYVRFIFNFTRAEVLEIVEALKATLLSNTYTSSIVKIGEANYSLEQLCRSMEGLYIADIQSGKKTLFPLDFTKCKDFKEMEKSRPSLPARGDRF